MGDDLVLLLVYVDDIIISSANLTLLKQCKLELAKEFKMDDRGPIDFALKIKVTQDLQNGTITLSQQQYILELIDRFDLDLVKPTLTPQDNTQILEPGLKMTELDIKTSPYPYRELVGALNYLVRGTRPDIANAVRDLSKYLQCFNQTHWVAAKRIMKYLKGTANYGLTYTNKNKSMTYDLYTDASFGSKDDGRYSVTGYCAIMSGAAVTFKSQKQDNITISTAEAELVACSEGCKESEWIRILLQELNLIPQIPSPTTVYCDNMATNLIIQNPGNHKCTKHIEIRHLYARELQDKNLIQIKYCKTEDMIADIFTKAQTTAMFMNCRASLGIGPI